MQSALEIKDCSTLEITSLSKFNKITIEGKSKLVTPKLEFTSYNPSVSLDDTSKIELKSDSINPTLRVPSGIGATILNSMISNYLWGTYSVGDCGDEHNASGFLGVCQSGNFAMPLTLGVYHSINVVSPDSNGGTSSADLSKAIFGTKVTLSNTPPAGKALNGWTITGDDGTTISGTTVGSDNKFTMPAKNVTVTPIYRNISSPAPTPTPTPTSSGNHKTRWYEIEVIQPEGATIEAPEKAKKNVGVDVVVNVKDGYVCKGIRVTDSSGKEYTIRPQADGSYQFTMPDKDVTVEAIIEKEESKPIQTPQEYILLSMQQKKAWVLDKWVDNDAAPIIRNGRTMLPARFIVEALGGTINWDADAQKATITKDGKTMEIFIGAGYAIVDGEVVALDAPAFIENGRTYLPLRFIAEHMGAEVIWDSIAQTVQIIPEK